MIKSALYKTIIFFSILLICSSCNNSNTDKDGEGSTQGKTIIETGELVAVNTKSFVLPRYGMRWFEMRVIGILDHGTMVNPGDSIVQLDPSEINKFIIERESDLENQQAVLEKLYVDQDNKIYEQESTIKSEKASFDLKKIELESSRFESERYKKIKKLEFKQAEIALAKEKRKLELTQIINKCDLKVQEVRVRSIEDDIKHAKNILPNLTLKTSISGVFQLGINRRTGTTIKLGDNIYPGTNMGNVPELKWMKVETYVNETDFLKIKEGQKVAIRLDALSNVVFDGEVSYLGKLCYLRNEKTRQKVFDVEVRLLAQDGRLKPGMTVSCEYLENN